jgi:hypothetical protein
VLLFEAIADISDGDVEFDCCVGKFSTNGGGTLRFFGNVESTIITARINTIDTSNNSQFTTHLEKHKTAV